MTFIEFSRFPKKVFKTSILVIYVSLMTSIRSYSFSHRHTASLSKSTDFQQSQKYLFSLTKPTMSSSFRCAPIRISLQPNTTPVKDNIRIPPDHVPDADVEFNLLIQESERWQDDRPIGFCFDHAHPINR